MEHLRPGDRQLIAELNTALVLDCIRREGPLPRVEVASRVGLGKSTVTGIVRRLLERGLLQAVGSGESSGGRRPEMLAFQPNRYFVAGLKLQRGGVIGSLTDLNGGIVAKTSVLLNGNDLPTVLDALEEVFTQLTAGMAAEDLLGCGVALPGLVDVRSGVSVAPHFFEWEHYPLQKTLEQIFSVPVKIENDARAAALGERWGGHGVNLSHFVFVSVGMGIGASIVLDGHIVSGDVVGGGHLGHTVVDPSGPICRCGQRGCLDVLANDEALVRYVQEAWAKSTELGALGQAEATHRLASMTDPLDVVMAAQGGDPAAKDAMQRVCEYIGIAIANTVKVLGIAEVIVGGETGTAGGLYLAGLLHESIRPRLFPEMAKALQIRPTPLKDDVWLVGAAALILESVFRAPIYSDDEASTVGVAVP